MLNHLVETYDLSRERAEEALDNAMYDEDVIKAILSYMVYELEM
ncbi:hypothetical protein AAC03nite_26380 [Alicyclobacillus acidoterrestris]|nr:hypothetical protein AAC03nite_26380 [Alicyclobacillus acidoterrestris]